MRMPSSLRAPSLVAIALSLAVVLPVGSCRLLERDSLVPAPFAVEPTGSDLAVSARFVRADDDISNFFKRAMPDSGVVPVRVVVRNDGSRTLVIHSANGMKVAPGFGGFALAAGGAELVPLHPKAVVARLVGGAKAERYRRHGVIGLAASTFVPPLAVYWGYGEIDIGRFYRPLFTHSFYPAREDGLFESVRLAPGEEREGWLYFALAKDAPRDSCELLVRGCVAAAIEDTLRASSFVFSRNELPFTENALRVESKEEAMEHPLSWSCDAPYGYLFALSEGAGKGGADLMFARVRALNPRSDSLWSDVTPVSSPRASIADASCLGSLSAVAVNFTSKSKVYLLQCAEAPEVFHTHAFSRGVSHVFLNTGGVYVVTDDRVCHVYDGAADAWRRGVKLGTDIDATAVVGDRILVFLKKREIAAFVPAEGGALSLAQRLPLARRVKDVIGLLEADLVVFDRVSAARGDEISILEPRTGARLGGGALAGKAAAAATADSSLVVELADGTLLRIVRAPLGTLDISEAGYLPFVAVALKAAPHGFIAVGPAGEFAIGSIPSWSPGARGAVEVSVVVR
jgi:hypothetical protein